MRIVCAESVLHGRDAFETIGEVDILPDSTISRADLRGADALVTRSKTKIDAELLAGSDLKFVGTATAGFDHIDTGALEEMGVHWTAAPGCNADSVAEYVVAALLEAAERHGLELAGRRLSIVGVGQVGSRVAARARGLAMLPLLNDPPRAESEGLPELRPLGEILPQADVVTLHTPLIDGGRHPTRGLANDAFFAAVKPGTIFINASRGEVVDEDALLRALDSGIVAHAILDVWSDEPHCRPELIERVEIATPHIAGYSYDGKLRGTAMIYAAICRFFGLDSCWDHAGLLPPSPLPEFQFAGSDGEQSALRGLVKAVYDIRADDADMRPTPLPPPEEHSRLFNRLRKSYPVRREFAGTEVRIAPEDAALAGRLADLGFSIARIHS